MPDLRLYKKFYRITNNNYVLINPFVLNASVYNVTLSALTEVLIVAQESTGNFYINITPSLYNSTDLYELRWEVNYTSSSSVKNLSLFFMYDTSENVIIYNNTYKFGEITYEITNNKFDIEITNNEPLIVEIKNNNG